MNDKDAAWVAKNFPSSFSRKVADAAIDKLSVDEPMHVYLDTWIKAYIDSGGKTIYKF